MIIKAFLDILFPPLCHICKEFIPDAGDIHLCPGCMEGVKLLTSPLCRVCGVPFYTEGGADHLCGQCAISPPCFAAARGATLFEGPVKELIHNLKYNKAVRLARPLSIITARHLAPFVQNCSPHMIIPVPLHIKRLRARGFNQSALIADRLSKEWGVPLSRRALSRVRWTEPQIKMSAEERVWNVKGAFAVKEPAMVRGRRVLLIDDVCTTGSTINECARTLLAAGAAQVFVTTAARAVF